MLFVLPSLVNAQTVTLTANGTAGSFKTGSVSSAGVKSDDAMVNINSTTNRGWAAFDLSTIPANAHVTGANIVFTTYSSSSSSAANSLYGFIGNAATMSGASLYTAAGTGTLMLAIASWTANATNTKAMTAAGIAYLNNNRANPNFNIGYVRASTFNYNIQGYGAAAASRPQLVVTYATTAATPACLATPTAPANAATGVAAGNFSWGTATNATNFKIYIGTDGGGTTLPTNLANGTLTNGNTFTLPTLPGNSTVYWSAVPTNGVGDATGCTIWSFTTAGAPNCATVPAPAIAATNIQRNPSLSWTAPSAPSASSYDVYFGTSPTPALVTNTTTASYTPALLAASTTYYWKVVPKNALGDATGCATWSFTTGTNVAYCTPITANGCTLGDVIAKVVLNTLTNDSGTGCPSGVLGYSDYTANTALTTTLQAGSTYSCTVFAGEYDQSYAAWIDYNDDGTFDQGTERTGFTTTPVAGSGVAGTLGSSAAFPITLSCNPPLGQHRLRIRANYFTTAGSAVTPCGSSTYSETEDYLITIAAAVPCPAPSAGLSSGVTNNQAVLNWTTGCAEGTWDVHVTAAGGGAPTGTASNPGVTKPFTKTGLTAGTNYEYWVRAVCTPGSLFSTWAGPYTFATLPDAPTCATALVPADAATGVSAPIATISWTAPTGPVATSYAVYFGTAPNPPSIGSTANTFVNITGLTVATTYYWRVEPSNNGGPAIGCVEQSFTTAATVCDAPTAVAATNLTMSSANITFTSTGTSFILEYGPTGFVPGTGATAGAGTIVTGTASPISITGLTANTPYSVYIRNDCGSGTISANSVLLSFTTLAAPPANNDIANAIDITGLTCSGAIYTNLAAGLETGEVIPSTANGGCWASTTSTVATVWFKFTAPASGFVKISTDKTPAGTLTDSEMALYSSSAPSAPTVSNITRLGCNGDGGTTSNFSSVLNAVVTPGATYFVQIAGYGTATGTFCIDATDAATSVTSLGSTTAACTASSATATGTTSEWITLCQDANGQIVMAINTNGQNLGNVTANYYVSTAPRSNSNSAGVATNYMNRNWSITSTVAPVSPVSLRLYMTDAELTALNTANASTTPLGNITFTHVPGAGCSAAFTTTGNTGATTLITQTSSDDMGSSPLAYIELSTPSFSSFYAHSGSSPLPITLKSFTATENGAVNVINWETAIESNVRNFVIEKSNDGKNWTNIGEMLPNISKRYRMNDNTPFVTTYYRLKNIDNDSREDVSNVVVVNRKTGKFTITSVSPNPTNNDVNLKFETTDNANVTINVQDIFGRVVLTQQVDANKGFNTVTVPTSEIPAGAYFLNVNDGTSILTQRIVKN